MVGISLHSIVPVRKEAAESAEQITQMLFGETCTILEQIPRWNRIKLDLDSQVGWVDAKMICPMKSEEYTSYREAYQQAAIVVFPLAYAVSENNNQTIPLTAGTRLNNYKDGRFEMLGVGFRIDPSMVIEKPLELNQQNIMKTIRFFINTPYLWGGKNALGMDCSGFTQIIMSLFGKQLLRNASEQVTQGSLIPGFNKAQAGDLAFFSKQDGKINHVGIIVDSEVIVHCSGRVKVEKLDEIGIFNAELGDYSHHLVQIRRY